LVIWKEVLGLVHVLGVALIVVGLVLLNTVPGH
jgi:multidrug transporter EmrE-like cation transporter